MFSTWQSQHRKSFAQQYLSIARRHLFLVQTITKFQDHFQYPLWESEKEYIADLLKVERLAGDKNAIQDTSSYRQRAQNQSGPPPHPLGNRKHVCDELRSEVRKEDQEDAGCGKKVAKESDSEAEDIEDQETEKAIEWLGAEWRSIVQILRQRDSNIDWDDVY